MSAMGNTTPIVITVMKPATNPEREKTPRDADATPRVNIQDFCEEYYEDIMPIVMDKICRDKRKEVHARAHLTDLAKLTRQVQPSPDRTGQAPRIVLAIEAALTGETLLIEIILRVENAPVASGNHMTTPIPPMGPTMDIAIATKTAPAVDPFTPRIRNFKSSRKTRMPNNVKTYDGTGDPKDHVIFFQAAAHVGRWAMPTWCHMFNSTLIGAARVWFDELPPESIYSYKELKAAFLAYFMQQSKYVKDPVEIHNIKQMDGETIEDFMERFKTMEEMMITTAAFIRGEAAVAGKKKGHTSWRTHDQSKRHTSEKRSDFQGQPREGRGSSRVTSLQGHQKKFSRLREITFPLLATSGGIEEPLVIEAKISGHIIHRMYVDGGSSTEVLYEHCFNRLRPEVKNQMVSATTSLTGFSGETIWPLGQLRLLVTIGDADHSTRAWMNFMIVRSLSSYNGIIRRPEIKQIQAVPSTAHGMLKFPADGGIVTIRSTILIPVECATVITSSKEIPKEAGARHENFKVALHPNFPDQEPSNMTGLPRSVAEHRLNIREGYSPVRQKKRGQAPKREKAIQAEKGNHQIQLAELDEEKTAFHTGQWVYCYTKMPFGLKNAGATYQRPVDKAFDSQIAPKPKEELIVYLTASYGAISAVLVTERGTVQTPVYFVSRVLQGPKMNYTTMEKLLLSLVFAAKRLQRTITKIERYAGRTQYHIPTKDVGERTASNNEAEYEALIAGLRIAAQMGLQNVHVSVDSKLVANQVLWGYVANEENMIKYLEKVKILVSGFANFSINQVPRSKNKKADGLSKIESTSIAHLSKQVFVEILKEKSTQEKEVTTVVEKDGPTWMTPIIKYLKERTLPGDRKEARKLRIMARQYELLKGVLYKLSFLTPWLRCVGPLQADYVIREIHEGSCSMHAGPRSVVAKTIRLGYDWPTMHRDARDMIHTCNDCQIHPGPFPEGPGKVKILIVAIDYFTKWIEAKAVATITGNQARLGEGNKNWIEELLHVLWAHRTMIKSSHGDIPYSLTYGTEAAIPAEIGIPTYRTAVVNVVHNDEELRLNLDLLEERREGAAIREAKAKLKMTKYYNSRVRGVTFRPGDFVYRSNDASHAVDGGKLGPKWEGPYKVTEALGDGAYKLRSADGTVLLRTWSVANLKKCYI
nr:reverse transcriptase domain-containing protein [Tanacetum cinerariifolium]